MQEEASTLSAAAAAAASAATASDSAPAEAPTRRRRGRASGWREEDGEGGEPTPSTSGAQDAPDYVRVVQWGKKFMGEKGLIKRVFFSLSWAFL